MSERGAGVPPPWTATRLADVQLRAREWLRQVGSSELTTELRAPRDPTSLLSWSRVHLDTRGGGERHAAPAVAWDDAQREAVVAAAQRLGLIRTAAPQLDRYASALILAGTTTGTRLRTELAAELASAGAMLGTVVALASARLLSPSEHLAAPESESHRQEWENALHHLDDVFGPMAKMSAESGGGEGSAWQDQRWRAADGRMLRLLVAPAPSGQPRATTADAVGFFLTRTELRERQELLALTSAIYVPYQFFTLAPLALRQGTRHVELVATSTATDGCRSRLAQRLGQEIHAAITTAVQL